MTKTITLLTLTLLLSLLTPSVHAEETNTQALLSANISTHNFNFSVTNLTEDTDVYRVTYTYDTYLVENVVWKEKIKESTLVIDKTEVTTDTLSTYITTQFTKVAQQETDYLKKVQDIENKRTTSKTSSLSSLLRSLVHLNIKAEVKEGVVTMSPVITQSIPSTPVVPVASPVVSNTTSTIENVATSSPETGTSTETINQTTLSTSTDNIATTILETATSSIEATTTPSLLTATTTQEIATSTPEATSTKPLPTVLGVYTSSIRCVSITQNLVYGSRSTSVTTLQNFLIQKGLLTTGATGFYGTKTKEAVRLYQKEKQLPTTGNVYSMTRTAIQRDGCR